MPLRKALVVLVTVLIVAVPAQAEYRGTDVFEVNGPPASLSPGGLVTQYTPNRYQLDTHIDKGTLGTGAIGPQISAWCSGMMWRASVFIVNLALQLFTFAFGLKLLTGENGVLVPVAHAIRSLYDSTFGGPLLIAAITAGGLWAMHKAWIEGDAGQAFTGLALAAVLMVVSYGFVLRPVETMSTVGGWADEISTAVLAGGPDETAGDSRRKVTDKLWTALVYKRWLVLQFGGAETCVDPARTDSDGVPQRVSNDFAGAKCRSNDEFARRYLTQAPGTDERKAEYDAINAGKVPTGDKQFPASYHLSNSDRPAVDMQQEAAADDRLTMTFVSFFGLLGVAVFITLVSLMIIVATMLALVLFGFAPVILIASAIPGRGHAIVFAWMGKIAVLLAQKIIYSIIIVVVLAVGTALALASLGLGYTFSSILQAGFYWAILFKHRAISDMLLSSGGGRLGRTPMKYAKQPLRTVADVSSFRTARATTAVQGTLQESALHGILNDERYDPRNRPDLQPQQPVTATETAAPATNGSYPPLAPTQGPGGSQPGANVNSVNAYGTGLTVRTNEAPPRYRRYHRWWRDRPLRLGRQLRHDQQHSVDTGSVPTQPGSTHPRAHG
jgi:hypothetical protein